MLTLDDLLNQRSHRDLELTARAHKLPFTRREPKAQGLAQLRAALQGGAYQKAFQQLTDEHIAALHALVVAGDWLPLPLFTAHFGEIRPYKPWRYPRGTHLIQTYARHPWRYPISVAERLYHLGFIHIDNWEMVTIVAEVKDMLPPLPQAEANSFRLNNVGTEGGMRTDLLRDVAALLGVLLQTQPRLVHGRWLPLTTLRAINERLQIKEDLAVIRSELQTGRLRWLHYLVEVSGLVSVQGDLLQPTVAAWRWLSAPTDVQWSSLMQAVERDLASREPLWNRRRFPEISSFTWVTLRHTLDDLEAAYSYRVKDFLAMLKPYLLADSPYPIASTLQQMFAWSGVLVLTRGRIFVHAASFERQSHSSTLTAHPNALYLTLPQTPSAALTTLLSFAQVTDTHALINAAAIRDAVRQGRSTESIIQTLQTLTGEPLALSIQQQIQAWVNEVQRFTLQQMVILYTPDASDMQRIRDDWRLAKYITTRLTPYHLAITAESAPKFMQLLERRGIQVTSCLPPVRERRITDTLNPTMVEYLLLAVRTYQKLQGRLDAAIEIPAALRHWLTAQVDTADSIEASADVLVTAVEQTVPAPSNLLDASLQDTDTIRRLIALAHKRGATLSMDYHSPYHGASSRIVEVHEVYDSNDVTYIEAYCHLVEDIRTFRMDRILRVRLNAINDIAV